VNVQLPIINLVFLQVQVHIFYQYNTSNMIPIDILDNQIRTNQLTMNIRVDAGTEMPAYTRRDNGKLGMEQCLKHSNNF
jgi:hypothetical protein